jgi:hypothetical protein
LRGEVEIPVEIADDLEAVLLSIRDGRPGAVEAAAKALAKLRAWLTR